MDELTNLNDSEQTCHPRLQPALTHSSKGHQNSKPSANPMDFSLQTLTEDDFEKSDSRSLAFLRETLSPSAINIPTSEKDRVAHRLTKTVLRKITCTKSVEILRVANICQSNSKAFQWGWVNPPVAGNEFLGLSIPVEGWLVGKTSQPITVRLIFNQTVIVETPVNIPRPDVAKAHFFQYLNCGYSTSLDTAHLPNKAEVIVDAVFPEMHTAIVGSILFRKYG
jgi:hypothetical protein